MARWLTIHEPRGTIIRIGNARGRIALYLDETDAIELVEKYPYPDLFNRELMEAVERAYPTEDEAA